MTKNELVSVMIEYKEEIYKQREEITKLSGVILSVDRMYINKKVEVIKLKEQIQNLKYVQSTDKKHDAEVIRAMIDEYEKEYMGQGIRTMFEAYADDLEKAQWLNKTPYTSKY